MTNYKSSQVSLTGRVGNDKEVDMLLRLLETMQKTNYGQHNVPDDSTLSQEIRIIVPDLMAAAIPMISYLPISTSVGLFSRQLNARHELVWIGKHGR